MHIRNWEAGTKFKLLPHSILCKAASEANLDLSFDWRGRDVAEEELLEELPDLEDMEDLLAQLIHWQLMTAGKLIFWQLE